MGESHPSVSRCRQVYALHGTKNEQRHALRREDTFETTVLGDGDKYWG